MQKRLACLVLWMVPLVLVIAPPGCGPRGDGSKLKRIILLTNGDDPFWDAMREGMNKAAADLKLTDAGYEAVLDKNDGTAKGQVDKLEQYANQTDIAAVGISVIDAENVAIANAMRKLRKQGVVVLTIDSDIDRDKSRDARFAYLGTDNIVGGRELGKTALGLRPEGGEYATFVGHKSAANAVERISGFAQGAGSRFEEVESLGDGMDHSKAQQHVRTALSKHAEIDCLVGIWAYNAHAIVSVVGETPGRREKTTIVVFDAAPKAISHMAEGNIDAMVVQNPYQMGYLGTKLMKALLEDDKKTVAEMYPDWDPEAGTFKTPDGDIYTTELRVVVPDASSPLKPEQFPDSKFFTLGDFKAWLAERNLTGS